MSILLPAVVCAQNWEQTTAGVKVNVGQGCVSIEYLNPASVRVVKTPGKQDYNKKSMVVTETPTKTTLKVREAGGRVEAQSSKLTVSVNLNDGRVSFAANGKQLFAESAPAQFTPLNDAGTKAYTVRQDFSLDADEAIYGFGQPQNEQLSQRHVNRLLQPQNVEDGIPFFASIKGYGIYWDNYSATTFNDDDKGTFFSSEVGQAVDYYFLYGGSLDGVVAKMRQLSGDVPMMPLWTYGFWQSRERYKSCSELEEVLTRYRQLHIPIDGIVQDWQYWGSNYLWNAMDFLAPEFADGKQMIDSVHNLNGHIIFTIWSSFGPKTLQYKELADKNLLFNFSTWPQSGLSFWPPRMDYPSGVRVYNPFSSEARDIYWKHLKRLYDYGTDGYWMDSTEPDMFDPTKADMDAPTGIGSFRSVRCAFPLATVGGVYDHQRQLTNDRRVFILTRSCFAGQQRYGCNVWSGDIISTWESMRKQLTAGLNFTLTGNPNFNCDLGGFFAGAYNNSWNDNSGCNNPAYRELYTRWIECGVFFPMMRSHGTEVYREFYYYGKAGEPIYDALVNAVKTRYALLPYIYSTSWQVTHNRSSFMRALPMDFANDPKVKNMSEEYMFGSSILAAPIVHAQYTPEVSKQVDANDGWNKNSGETSVAGLKNIDFSQKKSTKVYLPAGTAWYDYWTGEKLQGGQTLELTTSIASIPMFVKAGSILPVGPDVQYSNEKPWDNLTLRIFPGADSQFTLYEDEGDSYRYEQGAYTEIPMTWNEAKRQLTIGKRRGSFKGMLQKRNFHVVLPDGSAKDVSYSGKAIKVKF
ncbi:MAG: TIM-barrel domain-containing protein [Prevotella sp.]